MQRSVSVGLDTFALGEKKKSGLRQGQGIKNWMLENKYYRESVLFILGQSLFLKDWVIFGGAKGPMTSTETRVL